MQQWSIGGYNSNNFLFYLQFLFNKTWRMLQNVNIAQLDPGVYDAMISQFDGWFIPQLLIRALSVTFKCHGIYLIYIQPEVS
jgi:hypothetical protein